uniref:Uncharacterized protein n=1 Tax=Arundo donax TaxID=35708 RepID=A0A0A9A5N0_ARUDO
MIRIFFCKKNDDNNILLAVTVTSMNHGIYTSTILRSHHLLISSIISYSVLPICTS